MFFNVYLSIALDGSRVALRYLLACGLYSSSVLPEILNYDSALENAVYSAVQWQYFYIYILSY